MDSPLQLYHYKGYIFSTSHIGIEIKAVHLGGLIQLLQLHQFPHWQLDGLVHEVQLSIMIMVEFTQLTSLGL